MSSPRGGLEQEASRPCPSTRRMPPVSQRLRLEREASQPCSSRQHRLTCWHVLHAASGPSHALARFPATSAPPLPRHPASVDLMSGRHNLRCTCKTCVSRHRRRATTTHAITHSSAIEFAAMNFDIRIAGLIRARLFMPLAAFGLGLPFSAWACCFRPAACVAPAGSLAGFWAGVACVGLCYVEIA